MKRNRWKMSARAAGLMVLLVTVVLAAGGCAGSQSAQPTSGGEESRSDPTDDGAVDDGTVDDGTVDDGTVDDGAADNGAVDNGAADDETADDGTALVAIEAHFPFPQHDALGQYAVSPLRPQGMTPEETDEMVIDLFRAILRNDLIVDENGPRDRDGFRMVIRHSLGYELTEGMIEWCHINVSESQGYGMMMMAYLAGSEDRLGLNAEEWIFGSTGLKDYYDAMLRTVMAYPSVLGNRLFAWELNGYMDDPDKPFGYVLENGVKLAPFSRPEDGDSATDGDMDIIYSLLLADKQWGSDGQYNYLKIAREMLADLWSYCVHDTYHTLLLGDWVKESDDQALGSATRPSDFILTHLKAFKEADPDHDWQSVIDATVGVLQEISAAEKTLEHNYGLLPDFVSRKADDSGWAVAPADLLEGTDDAFAYNACRTPWRLGADYLLHGDTAVDGFSLYQDILAPLNDFANEKGVENLGPVELDGFGGESGRFDWTEPDLFAAPFLLAAVGAGDQAMVDDFYAGWTTWKNMGDDDWQPFEAGLAGYDGDTYGDYIQMLVLLTAGGNWWTPLGIE